MPEQDIRIYEIYDTIQGESTLAGTPCTIIRLAGCPLHCSYCDTPEALAFDSGRKRSIPQIVETACAHNRPMALVTGGEPLAQKSCFALLASLVEARPIVQLETSGCYDIGSVHAGVRRILDVKAPGSGEAQHNRWDNFKYLHTGDEIKFVLTDREDYLWALDTMAKYDLPRLGLPILFSPAWKGIDHTDLAEWMLQDNVPARLQLQQHKLIWNGQAKSI